MLKNTLSYEKGTLGLSAPDPDQEDDPPGPLSCGNNETRRSDSLPQSLEGNAKLDAVMLLARPLTAASPDAKHPGKAGKISGESSLSPGDYSRLSWGQKPSDFRKPQRVRRKLSISSNGVISPGAGPGYSVPWWGLG